VFTPDDAASFSGIHQQIHTAIGSRGSFRIRTQMLELKPNEQEIYAVTIDGIHADRVKWPDKAIPPDRDVCCTKGWPRFPLMFTTLAGASAYIDRRFPSARNKADHDPKIVPYKNGLKILSQWFDAQTRVDRKTGILDSSKPSFSDYIKQLSATPKGLASVREAQKNARAKAKQAT